MTPRITSRIANYFSAYFNLSTQLLPQAEGEAAIREGVSFRGTNIVILILAILIASLGLNTNSTAVIIGAMLISPLMGPIIGIGLGVGICDFALIKQAVRNLLMAATFSVVASTIYFLISPVSEGHSELLARTSPTIYDVLIGFVGGFAGILAIGSTSKGNVIPGVAIATALMPPLCTAGYGLATWQMNYFFGAGYLFIINSIYIAFATFIGVKLLKYKNVAEAEPQRARRIRRIVYTLAVLTMLPSVWLTWRMLDQTRFAMNASRFVEAECNFPDTQVLSEKTSLTDGERTLTITLIGRPLPADSLRLALSSRLGFYGLADTRLVIVQGSNVVNAPTPTAASQEGMRDFYALAQSTIMSQQRQIDSLRSVVAYAHERESVGARLAPELKILFPSVADIAVTSAVMAPVKDSAGAKPDTINVALITFSSPPDPASRKKLGEYLAARLKIDNLRIIDAPAQSSK